MRSVFFAAALTACLAPRVASAGPARVLADLDDARACLPLSGGGFAVGSGGGLAGVDIRHGASCGDWQRVGGLDLGRQCVEAV
jgi:hypothetical protein